MSNEDRLTELGVSTPQMAQAQAINHLSNPSGKASRTMSVLDKSDLPRFQLIFTLASALGYGWLKEMGDIELDCRASLKRKGRRGRDDIVDVSRPAGLDEQKGALASFRDSIQNFFSSG